MPKTPQFPRVQVIERQKEQARKTLRLDKETLTTIRGGDARYGTPTIKTKTLDTL